MKRITFALALLLFLTACGPYSRYERWPGLYLGGSEAPLPPDWSQVELEMVTQIQTRGILPVVNNIWAASSNGKLYVRGSKGNRWTLRALKNPEVRLRSGDFYYPLHLKQVSDPGEIERVNAAFEAKYTDRAKATAHYERLVFELVKRP